MRVLVVGGYGLIGGYVCARLRGDGHEVIGAGRDIEAAACRVPGMRWVRADLAKASTEDWAALLDGVEAVVNCAGALQDGPRDDLRAVHEAGVARLLETSVAAGVKRFVHLSAASVEEGRPTAFNATKWAGEEVIAASPIAWTILRPGLVLAPAAYGGTALLRGLAAFPLALPVVFADSDIQTVSIDDVTEAVARALAPDAPARVKADLVHAKAVTLAELVTSLRAWLGLKPAPVMRVAPQTARMTAAFADALGLLGWRSPMRTSALEQLRLGVRGDGEAAKRVFGITPKSLQQTLDAWPSGVQERWFAKSYFLKPVVLVALVAYWLLSGLIGLTFGWFDAVTTLTDSGMSATNAAALAGLGGAVDIGLALALCFRETARFALLGMLVVSGGYLGAGTVVRPDLWLDPLGPYLKIIPAALLALAALATLDER
jgi:uncharacterized protein YbjT (DUF2867 family)